MSALVEFLAARIAEDERHAASGARFASWNRSWDLAPVRDLAVDGRRVGVLPMDYDEHICRWDPARVLAECEAKRRVVEDYEHAAEDYRVSRTPLGEGRRFAALVAVARLAAVYSDHPDYQEGWRP